MTCDEAKSRSITVVVDGEGPIPSWAPTAGSVVVAADAGLRLATSLGVRVDHIVGDLDSVSKAEVDEAVGRGATVHHHDADKDATDSALALELAVALLGETDDRGAASLTVLGRGGGRLDHLLSDVLVLGDDRLADIETTAHFGAATISVIRPGWPRQLSGRRGEQVSLLPLHGAALGVTTTGLRWALTDAGLTAGTTRGLSNEFVDRHATVAIEAGIVLAVQPATMAPPIAGRSGPYDPSPRAG